MARTHRSNVIGMRVLPLQFQGSDSWQSLGLRGDERVDVMLADVVQPPSDALLVVTAPDGRRHARTLSLRIDTAIEVQYYQHGGILPYVLRQLLAV